MYRSQLDKRGRALENSFFIEKERIIISNLGKAASKKRNLETLKKYTGITDETVLLNAMEHGLSPSTFYAFIYFPVVYVAWADDLLDNKEKKKIRLIAKELGILSHEDSVEQIEYWLKNPPGEDTLKAWKNFFQEYKKNLKPLQLEKLILQIKDRAKSVAQTSGILPFIGDISKKEKLFLKKLDAILDEEESFTLTVRDFMTTKVKTVNEECTVKEVAELMAKENFSAIPVVTKNDRLVGILTESDFVGTHAEIPHTFASIKTLFGNYYYFSDIVPIFERAQGKKVKEVMSKNPTTTSPDCTLSDVIKLMSEKHLKRIPVVDNQKVVGIVTRKDIIRAFLMV